MTDEQKAILQDLIDDVEDYAASREFKPRETEWRRELLSRARALLAASAPNPITAGLKGKSCRTGHYDICHAAKHDGVVCPEGECDIDSGVRAAPLAQSAEQDRIDAERCFLDDDEITEAANRFGLGNPRFDALRGFANYVVIAASHKGPSK